MGEPVKIVDVAKRMIEYMGLDPEKDIDIKFVGLRPGERLHEELFWKGEGIVPTENKKITQLKPRGIEVQEFLKKVERLHEFELAGNLPESLRLLKEMVPEAKVQGSRI